MTNAALLPSLKNWGCDKKQTLKSEDRISHREGLRDDEDEKEMAEIQSSWYRSNYYKKHWASENTVSFGVPFSNCEHRKCS